MHAREQYVSDLEAREAARTSPERPIAELELGTRATEALAKAGVTKVGQVLDRLALGESAVLSIEGFGRKSLADLKKRLRQMGYQLPEAAEEIQV
ncbi:MAG TPA: DNA-directed RNA polymerase subunit alpha C-terminal domain-containing protein [Anaerolineales bacterium]|nr:DNA-directed RNA polymerase subunit alpha C-terminal domain-containing protein [Anaerolineales bacterium]